MNLRPSAACLNVWRFFLRRDLCWSGFQLEERLPRLPGDSVIKPVGGLLWPLVGGQEQLIFLLRGLFGSGVYSSLRFLIDFCTFRYFGFLWLLRKLAKLMYSFFPFFKNWFKSRRKIRGNSDGGLRAFCLKTVWSWYISNIFNSNSHIFERNYPQVTKRYWAKLRWGTRYCLPASFS